MTITLPRSYLFAPGHKPDLFPKAAASGADLVILDLEDAVPEHAKSDARAAVMNWLDAGRPVAIRINAPVTRWSKDDLPVCRHPGVAAVLVPKVEHLEELAHVSAALGPDVPLLPMIESARGLHQCAAIGSAAGVQRLVFGSLDFQADTGIPDDAVGLQFARSQLVLLSRVAGIGSPVDGITRRFDDSTVVEADAARARRLGLGGKLCIHPKQVAAVNAQFSPTAEEIAWAQQVVDADAASQGGVTSVSDGMIDRPVMLRARSILASAGKR